MKILGRSNRMTWSRGLSGLIVIFTTFLPLVATAAETKPVPTNDIGIESLADRQMVQKEILKQGDFFQNFRFENVIASSNITFEHRVVSDVAKNYKPVHYDHGNGISVADVNGDGYLDVYFLNQVGSNELWMNQGDGTFLNRTKAAGVGLSDKISVAGSFGDLDNDGDPDLYVTTVRMGNVLFENLGNGEFQNVTKNSGLGHVGHSSTPLFFDYNQDGRLDVLLTNVGRYTTDEIGPEGAYVGYDTSAFFGQLYDDRPEKSLIFKNTGQLQFRNVSQKLNFNDTGWTGDAHFHDITDNGYPDLYVLNMQGDDSFYVNRQGKYFEEKTEEYFPKNPWGAMGIRFFDYDNNGLTDLYLTDMHSDMSPLLDPVREAMKIPTNHSKRELQGGKNNIWGNAFWKQRSPGTFRERSDRLGLENYWPWGFSVGDLNANGYLDIFVTASMNYPFRYGINKLYLNNHGKNFFDAEFKLGIEPRERFKTRWFTLDCSGSDSSHKHCKDHSGTLEIWANRGSRSSVIFDLDNDGDLDIITNEFNDQPQVFVSNLSNQKVYQYLKIDLRGTRSNRDGIGTKLILETNERKYHRTYTGKSGYLSQSSKPVYFALPEDEKFISLHLKWPSGASETITNIEMDQLITLREPQR